MYVRQKNQHFRQKVKNRIRKSFILQSCKKVIIHNIEF